MQQSGQPRPMNVPQPPPPRNPVPTPPPMRTPGGAAYGGHTQFQSHWIPPPPPPMTSSHPQNQHMNHGRPSTAPFSIPPPPPHPPPPQMNNANNTQPDNVPLTSATDIPRHNQPLTSATYIPGHDTMGVGIPPLFEARTPYEAYSHNQPRLNQAHGISSVGGTYTRDDSALYGNVHYDKEQQPGPSRAPDVGKSSSNRHNGTGNLSPSEAPDHWPLDRVLLWLAANGFSDDWQETFKALELQGGEFLELRLGSGGRGNLGKMHQVVYPQLAKECARRGSKFDLGHEREEGKRMRKLIRQIHDGSEEASVSTPQRTDLPLFSAEALPGFYSNAESRSAGGSNDIGTRPSPQDRQCSSEISSSLPREHNNGSFNFLRRKAKADSSHPSPEDQFLESPTSPEAHQNGPYPLYLKPSFNSSDVSVGECPSSTHTSGHEKVGRTKHTSKGKRWIPVTMDGWNYRLIDVSEMETAESLRTGICHYLGISDWGNAQIYLTKPEQSEHEEPINDTNLSLYRTNRSDPYGSLKLFVRGAVDQSAQSTPRVHGLGVSFPEKPASSPTTLQHQLHRKPLDEDTLNRISPHTQVKPLGSPSHQTFKTFPVANESQDRTTDSEKDTRARYEDNLRKAERKQKAYRGSQLHHSQQTLKDASGDMVDPLVPPQRAPTAPNESSTLTKVNFAKRIASREARPQLRISTHGLGTGLTSVGRTTSAIGTPSPSVPVSFSTPSWDSASSESERPATIDSVVSASSQSALLPLRPSPKLTTEQEAQKSQESFGAPSPAMTHSSIASQEPPLQSFGSKFKFEKHEISLQRSPNPLEDSNDSSNDGLWTIQPSHKAKQAEASPQKAKPTFPIDTENKRNSEVHFSIEKLGDERDDCDHEAEEHSHTDSPSTMETSFALPENFEELLLRWTKLGRNEVQALGNPRSQIWTAATTICSLSDI
ncbi:hypothetical protein N7460_006605 [Penicillium canescens]|uniref:SAM domain-containing protein n=1 Tax=Penicillium canescens TaxID=5083 RepID=A0AAD6NBP0_PENCN|nr:hypothetical protein N7460_006605 [Penicillium canescens]